MSHLLLSVFDESLEISVSSGYVALMCWFFAFNPVVSVFLAEDAVFRAKDGEVST